MTATSSSVTRPALLVAVSSAARAQGRKELVEMFAKTLFFTGLTTMILSVVGGLVPLWRSRTLSPASIKRRVYWTGCSIGISMMFLSQVPQWRAAIVIALAMTVGVLVIAFGNTAHIKVGGKIYAAYRTLRQPDPPPALERRI